MLWCQCTFLEYGNNKKKKSDQPALDNTGAIANFTN